MKIRNLLYLFLLVYLLPGCDIEDCFSTKTNKIKFGFYNAETDELQTIRVLNIGAEGTDSLLVENRHISRDTLEVNLADTLTTFYFDMVLYEIDTIFIPPDNIEIERIDTLSIDTLSRYLQISYDRSQRIISPECGVEEAISNLTNSSTDFGKVEITDNELDRFDEMNVKIYL